MTNNGTTKVKTEEIECVKCSSEVTRIVGDSGVCENDDCEVLEFKLESESNMRFIDGCVVRDGNTVRKSNLNDDIDIKEEKLREQFDSNTEFEPQQLIDELRNTVHSDDLQLIQIADQKLRIRVADQYYVRVYHISGTDDMYVTHVDVPTADQYYLDQKEDLIDEVSETVSDLSADSDYYTVEKNNFQINLGDWL
jgi:hypothetical protein